MAAMETINSKYEGYRVFGPMVTLSDMNQRPIYMEFHKDGDQNVKIQRDSLTNAICGHYGNTIMIAEANTCCLHIASTPPDATLIEYFNGFVVLVHEQQLKVYRAPEMTNQIKVSCPNKVKSVYDFKTRKHAILEINGLDVTQIYELDLFGDLPSCAPVKNCFTITKKTSACKFDCSPELVIGSLHGGGIGYAQYCVSCGVLEASDFVKKLYTDRPGTIAGRFAAINERGIIIANPIGKGSILTEIKYY